MKISDEIRLILEQIPETETEDIDAYDAGVAIVQNGKLLIVKRLESEDAWPGHFELPSGGVEEESLLDAMQREMMEETGLEIDEVLSILPHFYYTHTNGKRYKQVTILVQPTHDNVQLHPDEHSEYLWLLPNEIAKLDSLLISEEMLTLIKQACDAIQKLGK